MKPGEDRDIAVGLDKDSWCYTLLELLANFPNAYADIAAYDYQNEKYMDVLGSLLAGSTVALPDPLAENIPEILIKKTDLGIRLANDHRQRIIRR